MGKAKGEPVGETILSRLGGLVKRIRPPVGLPVWHTHDTGDGARVGGGEGDGNGGDGGSGIRAGGGIGGGDIGAGGIGAALD